MIPPTTSTTPDHPRQSHSVKPGPYVELTGGSVKIINPWTKSKRRRLYSIPALLTTSLSSSAPHSCVFCHHPAHTAGGLGDLFGPYCVRGEEVWLHLDCVFWVPAVHMVRGNLLGLEEGVEQCKTLLCGKCETSGASVGCTQHRCEEVVHLVCGREAGWGMDEDRLDARCPRHRRE
eukprot:GFUD01020285.1.p1 GENE.GFUD01020285.1~~GFUD01020285.1.p1  ORF type:complete len:176 (+),score=62.37 GFUD01020285.1:83-610(+)